MPSHPIRKPDRRAFLKTAYTWAGLGLASAAGVQLGGCSNIGDRPASILATVPAGTIIPTLTRAPSLTPRPLYEAKFYHPLSDKKVQCVVCFRMCTVDEGKLGFCANKKNIDGRYYSLVYGLPCALHVDPIEKEPSFHMLPGTEILCTGTASCNLRCKFCQNWEMSQQTLWETWNIEALPEQVVEMAIAEECSAVSFTYNEPTVFYEQMYDTAEIARKNGLGALFHTNGMMNTDPLLALLEHMDAITVDLKGFTPEFYQRVSSAELWPVLRTLQNVRRTDTHLEIVNLVIPTINDDLEDIHRMCAWVAEKLGPSTPLHFIRFFPGQRTDIIGNLFNQVNPCADIERSEHVRN